MVSKARSLLFTLFHSRHTSRTCQQLLSMQPDSSSGKTPQQTSLPATVSSREAAKTKTKGHVHAATSQSSAPDSDAEASSAVAGSEPKESSVPLDLRRTKTAGEALLRPSATDGLIARASKISTLSLIDKKGAPRAALRMNQAAAEADAGGTKSQGELQRILKVLLFVCRRHRPLALILPQDTGYDSDETPRHGEAVPLNNIQVPSNSHTHLHSHSNRPNLSHRSSTTPPSASPSCSESCCSAVSASS